MAGPTLTTLPAELRQKIIAETITITISTTTPVFTPLVHLCPPIIALGITATAAILLTLSTTNFTPFGDVCALLQADILALCASWLPTPTTPITLSQNTRASWAALAAFSTVVNARAARLNRRAWPGITTLTLRFLVPTSAPLDANLFESIDPPFKWAKELRRLPASVKLIKLDLSLPDAHMTQLCAQELSTQRVFWYECFRAVRLLDDEAKRRGIVIEVLGELPRSQVAALAPVAGTPAYFTIFGKVARMMLMAEGYYRHRWGVLEHCRQGAVLNGFVRRVRATKEWKEECRQDVLRGEIWKREYKKVIAELSRRMSALKKRKREEDGEELENEEGAKRMRTE
ncbi:hypothetical protein BU16DRAFT_615774 [Lophium mytilinum]|uniref:Uncharacterized protein n=1 Tax=Lophium mytilinum TaxID=390894 RepID=A0A6A6R3A0_9PEZI|nr:hypothetical protein BU16DRAFT_615774 [Lophium mytilinum]